MVLIRNPNQDYIRQLIWTAETGEEGTPHIQAYIKLIKQQRMSFVKKLFPSGHFQPITSPEYNRNAVDYAQKEDETTTGAHVNTMVDTIADPVYLLNRLLRTIIDKAGDLSVYDTTESIFTALLNKPTFTPMKFPEKLLHMVAEEERLLVRERPSICKLLVSAQYSKIKSEYIQTILKYNIDKYIQQRDANYNEGEGSGTSSDGESESISSASEEEEIDEEDCSQADEGFDSGGESDCEEEGGDETLD